jgi:hypothetical protein
MISALLRTARERVTLKYVLSYVVPIALLYGITRNEGLLLGLCLAFGVIKGADLLRETPGIDSRWVDVGVGAFITLGSLAWFVYEYTVVPDTGGPVWFPLLTALVGIWFLLDSRRDLIEGRRRDPSGDGSRDDMTTSEAMVVLSHTHLVVEALRSGPKTVSDLADSCDLTESRVQEALDVATDDDTIYRVDSEASDGSECYALDESKVGSAALVRVNMTRAVRRLLRPFHR